MNNDLRNALILLVIVAVSFGLGYLVMPAKKINVQTTNVDTLFIYDTVKIEKTRPVFLTKVIDSTKFVNLDSIQQAMYREAFDFWAEVYAGQGQVQYVAQKDTSIDNDKLSLRVSYHSPLVLHPDSYFNINTKVKTSVITNTVKEVVTIS